MEKLLNIQETAELLNIAPKTLYRWASMGHIPCITLHSGKRKSMVRFSPSALERWLKDKETKPEKQFRL